MAPMTTEIANQDLLVNGPALEVRLEAQADGSLRVVLGQWLTSNTGLYAEICRTIEADLKYQRRLRADRTGMIWWLHSRFFDGVMPSYADIQSVIAGVFRTHLKRATAFTKAGW